MRRGYTLLEIMVALFIMALVVGLAVPIYTDQINKSKVAAALITLRSLEQTAKQAFEENPANTSISYAGSTLTNNTLTALSNTEPVINGFYISPGGHANVSTSQFLVCVYVDGLSFTNYVAPTAGTAGSYSRICKQVTAADPIYTNMCGSLEGSSADVPTKYLPTGCNCANIWAGTC